MYRSITALIAIALLSVSSLSLAADKKPDAAGATAEPAKTTEKGAVKKKAGAAAKSKPTAQAKLVDINSASKAELMKLPGVSDAEADKIIAGRPYLTKTRLVTKNILSMDVYQGLKKLIIARQK